MSFLKNWGGDLLSFGGDLLSWSESRKGRKQAQRQFDAQMDQSVQRRVEDAWKAGVHPLFALGASTGASPTLSAGVSGSGLGDAVSRAGERLAAKKLLGAQIDRERAAARKDEAEAALINSERKRLEGNLVARGHDGASTRDAQTYAMGELGGEPLVFGPVEHYAPPVPYSKAVGVEAGTPPLMKDFIDDDGQVIRVYGDAVQGEELRQAQLIWHEAKKRMARSLSEGRRWFERELWKMNLQFDKFKKRKGGK